MDMDTLLLWGQLVRYGGLLATVIAILQIIVIVLILTGRGSPGHKLLWVVVVVLLPVVGMVLWVLLGRKDSGEPLPK